LAVSTHTNVTVTVTVIECDIVPLLAVIVAVWVPGSVGSDVDTVSVDVAVPFGVRVMLPGLN